MARRLAHNAPADRFLAPLQPRRELLEALWNLAYWATDHRRRKAGFRKVSVLKVPVWVQADQNRFIAAYRRHLKYLKVQGTISRRTLSRHVACCKRMKLLSVINPSYFDPDRGAYGAWVHQDNVYTVTYLGKLWIKRHARAVKIPLVV